MSSDLLAQNKNSMSKFVSTRPIVYSEETMVNIENSLKEGGYKGVYHTETATPGLAECCIKGSYGDRKTARYVFIEISCEEKDKGTVCISASQEHIENLKQCLKKSVPGIKFREQL